jgi:DNA-binding NtrC family response regulator
MHGRGRRAACYVRTNKVMETLPRAILVVESDPIDRASTVALIESLGHEVIVATNFDEAKRALTLRRPDLLVTGLRLGSQNGLHLVIRSRWLHPDLPAIVTTRHPDPVLRQETDALHATYLERPIEEQPFATMINTLLAAPAAGSGIRAPLDRVSTSAASVPRG